jgi:hypothetical protein
MDQAPGSGQANHAHDDVLSAGALHRADHHEPVMGIRTAGTQGQAEEQT